MNGYNYYWKDRSKDSTLQTGVVAQEVQQVFPELVKTDNNGFLSVNYTGLIPVMIQAIKEQQDEINQLKKENEELQIIKEQMAELKRTVASFSNK